MNPSSYGTLPPPQAGRRAEGGKKLLAGVVLLCVAVVCVATWRLESGLAPSVLLGGGDLQKDASGIHSIDDEVDKAMAENNQLLNKYHSTFAGNGAAPPAKSHCNCDCGGTPQFSAKAGQMLAQIGDNVFFGPCASCPCMRSNSLEGQVEQLTKDLTAETAEQTAVKKKELESIPVDIVIRQGPKGTAGTMGPVGFKGPEGNSGDVGYQGETGAVGDRGQKGVTGPKGYKGDDGQEGGLGPQGDQGDQGPPGRVGGEGAEGQSGGGGPAGANGNNGGNGG
ncbi:hypothetical protein T484DRAFT_2019270, partial [Baffinella frigidus]